MVSHSSRLEILEGSRLEYKVSSVENCSADRIGFKLGKIPGIKEG